MFYFISKRKLPPSELSRETLFEWRGVGDQAFVRGENIIGVRAHYTYSSAVYFVEYAFYFRLGKVECTTTSISKFFRFVADH